MCRFSCNTSCNISCNTHWHCNICNFRSYMGMETFKLTFTTDVGIAAGAQMRQWWRVCDGGAQRATHGVVGAA